MREFIPYVDKTTAESTDVHRKLRIEATQQKAGWGDNEDYKSK
jgi:hypothetical protein